MSGFDDYVTIPHTDRSSWRAFDEERDGSALEPPRSTVYLPHRNWPEIFLRDMAVDVLQKKRDLAMQRLDWDLVILVPAWLFKEGERAELHGGSFLGVPIEVRDVEAPMVATRLTAHHIRW